MTGTLANRLYLSRLPRTDPQECRHHQLRHPSRHQPRPPSLERHIRFWWCPERRTLRTSPALARICLRHACILHRRHCSQRHFRRTCYQSSWQCDSRLPLYLLRLLRHCIHTTFDRLPSGDSAFLPESQGSCCQLDHRLWCWL